MLCEYIRALGLYDDSADHGKKFFWLEITNLNIHNYLDRRYSQNYEITNIETGCAILLLLLLLVGCRFLHLESSLGLVAGSPVRNSC